MPRYEASHGISLLRLLLIVERIILKTMRSPRASGMKRKKTITLKKAIRLTFVMPRYEASHGV
jgi:hypothetical protein